MIGDALELIFKITADPSGVKKGMAEASSAVAQGIKQIQGSGSGLSGLEKNLLNITSGFTGVTSSAHPAELAVKGVTAGIGIMTWAVVGASAALFALAVQTSDYGSKVFDATQKTRLTAETITTMAAAASQGGSNFDATIPKLAKFTASLVDAAAGNKLLRAELKQFGIDGATAYTDPDKALRQFVTKFNELPASAEKNRIAMTLFKDKTGEIIPVLEQVGGNFDEFQAKLEKLGLTMTDEQARASDAMGDTLTELGQIALGVGRQFAFEFIPQLTAAMRDLEDLLVRNKDAWNSWGTYISRVIQGARIAARALAEYNAGPGGLGSFIAAFQNQREQVIAEDRRAADIANSVGGGRLGKGSGVDVSALGRGGEDKALRERLQALERAKKEAERIFRDETEDEKREYELRAKSLEAHTARLVALENQKYEKLKAVIEKQRDLAKKADKDKYDTELQDLERGHKRELQRIDDDSLKEQTDSLEKHQTHLLKLQDDFNARMAVSERARAEAGAITYEQAEQNILETQTASFNRQLEIQRAKEAMYANNLEKFREVNDETKRIIEEQVKFQEEAESRIAEAQERDLNRLLDIASSVYDAEKRIEAQQRDLDEDRLRRALRLELTLRGRQKIIADLTTIELDREQARYDAAIAALDAEEAKRKANAKGLADEKVAVAAIIETYKELRKQEDQRSESTRKDIMRRGNDASESQDPFSITSVFGSDMQERMEQETSAWRAFGETVASVLDDMAARIPTVTSLVAGMVADMASGIGSLVKQYILYRERQKGFGQCESRGGAGNP